MRSLHDFAVHTDKSFAHQYIHVYEALFEPIRNDVQTVLELGINEGHSLRMWRDYFDRAEVYGIDILDNCQSLYMEPRIHPIFCDAYSPETVGAMSNMRFDIIVDDGPHTLESQCFAVSHYSNLLSENGILVVEDIPKPEWIPIIADRVPEHLKMYSYVIDRRWVPNRQSINDELMFVVDKRYV